MVTRKFQILVFFLLFFVASGTFAQSIAFVNSDDLLQNLPAVDKAKKEVKELNKKYKDELQLMQNDYNKKYSDFISYQTSMAENIRLRRMQELYELEKQIQNFMEVAQKDVLDRENELIKPLRAKIKEAIYQVGVEGNFTCVYDLSNPAILFVTPDAIDITALVKAKMGVK